MKARKRSGCSYIFPGAGAGSRAERRARCCECSRIRTCLKEERAELVQGLRECVAAHPDVSELRVLFGMALCVDFQVPDAIEELREGVRLAPDSFIAQLKMGELWMRLRVIEKAEEHTRQAALLAQNMAQSELARRQAATIRTYCRTGSSAAACV